MASGTRGYNSYRGRGRKGKIFLAILLILIILASVGFILGREHMTYDAEGNLHFPWPWAEDAAETPPLDVSSDELVIQEPETETKNGERLAAIRGVLLSGDPAEWEAALTGDDLAFAVTVKAGGGTLCYPFEATAAGRQVSAQAAAMKEALQPLLNGERYSIARLSCLRDGGVARENLESMGLENTGGYIFYDGRNENWLDPGKEETASYLTALARECADLGFDEILLTDFTYPTEGKLDKIAYTAPDGESEDERAETLASLLTEIREALPAGVRLSMEIPEAVLENDGVDTDAGIDLWNRLMSRLDRIYVPTEPERVDALVTDTLENGVLIPELSVASDQISCQCYLLTGV